MLNFARPDCDRAVLGLPIALLIMSLTLPSQNQAQGASPLSTTSASSASPFTADLSHPMLTDWQGAYGGIPPFDNVRVADFTPAIQSAMDMYRADIRAIAENPEAPSFKNTLDALEVAGRPFQRVMTLYSVWSGTLNTSEFQLVEREVAPRLAAIRDEVTQNRPLFKRIEAIYNASDKSAWTAEQRRLAWYYHNQFVRSGARLDDSAQARVREINQELATLFTRFTQNLLADEEGHATVLDSEEELAGLPPAFRSSAAASANDQGHPGKWIVANTRSSAEPFLTYSDRRDLREKVWRNFIARGDHTGERDNKPIITKILSLRAERAKLLGYTTHAHWRLEDSMAATPERAMELMEAVWKPAVARVHEEVADMQKIADSEAAGIRIEPWDYRYYAEKVRKARYDLDQNAVKPYLELNRLRDGMFWIAEELLGLRFIEAADVPTCHPDVRVWEVRSKSDQHVGLFYFDPFARPGKRSGAWMSTYRRQERVDGNIATIVSNNCNFMEGAPGEPTLISWDDATTLLHEFGHALHGLCSDVTYPSLAGTSVARDYVELPSQLLERWLSTPEFLSKYARHHSTGEPIPQALVERIQRAAKFNQGFATTEFLASGLMDMLLHLAGDKFIDPAEFESTQLRALGMPSEIVMRHRLPQFAHVFASDGYSAGYYSYLWADTLTADAAEAFREAKGFYDTRVATRFLENVLSRGNTIDPAEGYRAFRGRDAGIEPLMRDRGFPMPGAQR